MSAAAAALATAASAAALAATSAAASAIAPPPPAPAAPVGPVAPVPATTTITASNHTNSLLQLFTQQPHARALYHDAPGRYLTAVKALKLARVSLEKFKQTCNRGQQLCLPRSMRLDLVSNAKLPTVEGKPQFHDETTAALRSIEATATKATYDALVAAKERHITHLEQCANAHAFIQTAVAAHRTHVAAYVANMDSSLAFPVDAAVEHFQQHLLQRITELNMQAAAEAMHEQATAAQARIDDTKAQETVLAGASNGQTLAKLAERAVQQQLQRREPIMRGHQQRRQQHEDQTMTPPAAANQPDRQPLSSDRHAQSANPRGQKRDSSRGRSDSEQKRHKTNQSGNTAGRNSNPSHASAAPGKFVFRSRQESRSEGDLQHMSGEASAHSTPLPDSSRSNSHSNRDARSNSHSTNSRGGGAASRRDRHSQQPTPRRHPSAQQHHNGAKQRQGGQGRASDEN